MVLLFWCQLTQVVLEKKAVKQCSGGSSSSMSVKSTVDYIVRQEDKANVQNVKVIPNEKCVPTELASSTCLPCLPVVRGSVKKF